MGRLFRAFLIASAATAVAAVVVGRSKPVSRTAPRAVPPSPAPPPVVEADDLSEAQQDAMLREMANQLDL